MEKIMDKVVNQESTNVSIGRVGYEYEGYAVITSMLKGYSSP
jgi:hypothetical protein